MSTVNFPSKFDRIFEPARYKAFFGGRGSGKSHTVAGALVILAYQKERRILCAREIQKSLKQSSKQIIVDKINSYGLSRYFKITDSMIRCVNGSMFLFEGLRTNPEAIKSMEGLDYVWLEEASSISKASIELLIPTVRKTDSEIWFSWNPRFPTDPVEVMFRCGEPPPRTILFEVGYQDNPWFPQVLMDELEWDRSRDPDKYNHVWLGGYQTRSDSQVFQNWVVEDFSLPPETHWYYGADWGFSVDPTVILRVAIVGRKMYIDSEAYMVGCEIDRLPILFDKIKNTKHNLIVADSSRPETISYMNRQGYNMIGAKKGAGSVEDGVEFIKGFDVVIHPNCVKTQEEFLKYSYKVDKLTSNITNQLEDANNHCIDAIRYALESYRYGLAKPMVRRL